MARLPKRSGTGGFSDRRAGPSAGDPDYKLHRLLAHGHVWPLLEQLYAMEEPVLYRVGHDIAGRVWQEQVGAVMVTDAHVVTKAAALQRNVLPIGYYASRLADITGIQRADAFRVFVADAEDELDDAVRATWVDSAGAYYDGSQLLPSDSDLEAMMHEWVDADRPERALFGSTATRLIGETMLRTTLRYIPHAELDEWHYEPPHAHGQTA